MHRINRVEIELEVDDVPLAQELSDRAGRMHERRIAPILDRVCGELSDDQALDRIDRLEVDLGAIPVEGFEEDFVARLEPALRAALSAALRRRSPRSDQPARAALEVLEVFALTGSLPWWADARDEEVVARHFARAAGEAPEALVALLRRIAGDTAALDRLARASDAEALLALAGAARVGEGAPRTPGPLTPAQRRALLSALAAREAEPREAREAVGRVAKPDGTVARGPSVSGTAPAAGAAASGEPGRSERTAAEDQRTAPEAPTIVATAAASGGEAGRSERTAEERRTVSTPSEAEVTGAQPPPQPMDHADSGADLAAGTREELVTPIPAVPAPRPPAAPRRLEVPSARPGSPATIAPAPTTPAIQAARRAVLARLDELYVDDAGLVLLWPFLERFFVRIGLVEEEKRRFLNEDAAIRGVALLEALVTGDPAPPLEFRLPLPKLLCGRALESDFALEDPLPPEQLAEGDVLLTAAIDRAQVLGELSIPGFRSTFLQRRGALTTRDGAWLLQVERQTHDVLLDRFPWSWSWVKLPWMPDPLQVEW